MFHTKLHSLRLLTFCRNHFECFTVFLVALKNKVKGKRFIINRKRGLSFYFYFPENKTKKTQALICLKNSSLSLFFLSSFIFPISPLCLLPCSLSHLSSSQSLLVLSFPLSSLCYLCIHHESAVTQISDGGKSGGGDWRSCSHPITSRCLSISRLMVLMVSVTVISDAIIKVDAGRRWRQAKTVLDVDLEVHVMLVQDIGVGVIEIVNLRNFFFEKIVSVLY